MTTIAVVLPAVDSSVGAFLIGTFLSILLAGVTTTQAYTYYSDFAAVDRRPLVVLVTVLKTLGMIHTAICCHLVYLWTVSEYGNYAFLTVCPEPFAWGPVITGLTAFLVQCFYAWRVYVVSGRRLFLSVLICVVALVQLAFAIGMTVEFYLWRFDFAFFHTYTYGVALWLLSAVAADLLITVSLVHYLRACLDASDKQWRPLVMAIISNTIQTNGLTWVATIINATLFLADKREAWHIIPGLTLVQLYIVSALVSLNSRTALQQHKPTPSAPTRITYIPAPAYNLRSSTTPLVPPASAATRSRVSSGGWSADRDRGIARSSSKKTVVDGIKVTQFRQVSLAGRSDANLESQLEFELTAPLPLEGPFHHTDPSAPNIFGTTAALQPHRGLTHAASFASIPEEHPESPVCASPSGENWRASQRGW